MTKDEILNTIIQDGFIHTGRMTDEEDLIIHELVNEGTIESIINAGLQFMNGDYCFVLKGNPSNVYIKTEGYYTFVSK